MAERQIHAYVLEACVGVQVMRTVLEMERMARVTTTDQLNTQADGSRGPADASNVSNSAETAGMSHGEGVSTYLGIGGMKRGVEVTNSIGSHADTAQKGAKRRSKFE